MASDEELGQKSREARELSKKPRKPGLRETHRRINSSYNAPFWLLGAAGAAMRLPVPTGTPVF